MVINPGKHPRGKQRYQDKCWKLHDHAQSFLLCSYTLHELCNQISIGLLVSMEQATIVFCALSRQKRDQKQTTKLFVWFYNHSPLLAMVKEYQI